MNYLDTRPNSHGLFNEKDEPIILEKSAKEVANHAGAIWTHIISLRRDDAERMGYNTLDAWKNLVRRRIADIAEAQKISQQNIRWYAAFHNNENNPHVHIVVYSANPKEGYLTKNGIEKIRSSFANDIYRDELQNLYSEQTVIRNKLRSNAENVMKNLLSELQNGKIENPQIEQLILKLRSQLQISKGKKLYGYLQPNVKKTVDQIVAELAKNPVLKKMYDEWCRLEQQKYETYTSAVQKFPRLEENKAFKPIKNAVIRAVLDMEIQQNEQPKSDIQNTIFDVLKTFANLISDDYDRSFRGQKLRTEHKLKSAIRRKKQALGLKENTLENPQFKE